MYMEEMKFDYSGLTYIMVKTTIIDKLKHACHILGLQGNPWHKLDLLMLTLPDKSVTTIDLTVQMSKLT